MSLLQNFAWFLLQVRGSRFNCYDSPALVLGSQRCLASRPLGLWPTSFKSTSRGLSCVQRQRSSTPCHEACQCCSRVFQSCLRGGGISVRQAIQESYDRVCPPVLALRGRSCSVYYGSMPLNLSLHTVLRQTGILHIENSPMGDSFLLFSTEGLMYFGQVLYALCTSAGGVAWPAIHYKGKMPNDLQSTDRIHGNPRRSRLMEKRKKRPREL